MRKAATIGLSVLASAALFVAVVFTCVEWVAFDESRYWKAQEQYGLEAVTGMSREDLRMVTRELLAYCRGDRDNLEMQATINGQLREVFDQREKAHMVDVQKLFRGGTIIRIICVAAFLFLALLLIYFARRRVHRELARGWLVTIAVLGALLAALGIWFAVDFEGAFTRFHLLFFTNDLWLLYPDEVLIQMLPGQFFFSLAQAIVVSSAAALAAITALAAAVLLTGRKKKETDADDA